MGFTSILPVFVALVIGSSLPAQAEAARVRRHGKSRCPTTPTFKEQNGFCYFFSELLGSHDHGLTDAPSWAAAKAKCESLKVKHNLGEGGLAEFGASDNLGSDEWLMLQIMDQDHPVWLGARDVNNDNTWQWDRLDRVDRELSLLDAYWGPSQPNNYEGPQNCLATQKQGNDIQLTTGILRHRQYFNDEDCNRALPYVCQFKLKKTDGESNQGGDGAVDHHVHGGEGGSDHHVRDGAVNHHGGDGTFFYQTA